MTTFPGMSRDVADAVAQVLRGEVPDSNKINARNFQYWHRQNIGAALAPGRLDFFGVSAQEGVTNMPQAGSLPAEHVFILNAVRVGLQRGYNIAGGAEADGEAYQATVDALKVAADMEAILKYGRLTLTLASRLYIDSWDLTNFPEGGGLHCQAALTDTSSTASKSFAVFSNGIPNRQNAWRCSPTISILPQMTVNLSISHNISRTLEDSYVIMPILEGILVTPKGL